MGRRKKIVQECEKLMDKPENIRNIAIAAHVDHGKTTLTDNLLAGAGMISDETAGEQLAMDTEEDEQERGITIDAANVSMTHEYEGTNHLINLIDTPGHVDFGGDVTRAMRAVDGALVVVDAVEGAMPQTETVLRQALREGVKPTLFINKVDRLISELQEGPEEMQQRMTKVIRDVNELIRGMTEEMDDINDDWTVSVEDGTVGFGSALYKWGVSLPSMQRTGMDFGDIIELERNDKRQELAERTPLADVVLDMVCEHFPNPIDAQPRRIPRIWRGDDESEIAGTMREVDPEGEVVFMVTDISMDPHAGEIATGRVFSGTLEKGQELHVSGTVGTNRLQSVGIFMGGEREEVDRVPAGNVAAVTSPSSTSRSQSSPSPSRPGTWTTCQSSSRRSSRSPRKTPPSTSKSTRTPASTSSPGRVNSTSKWSPSASSATRGFRSRPANPSSSSARPHRPRAARSRASRRTATTAFT
jgi:elongation factor 2